MGMYGNGRKQHDLCASGKRHLLGFYLWKGGLDLLNIVLIGISNAFPEHDEKYELHRLLSTLLSMELTVDEKLGIIL